MTVKLMIIDGQADFCRLLMHHATTAWHDAVVSTYDPIAAGHLPAEFSGAGNDIILLGSVLGEREGPELLQHFSARPGFPPLVYFGTPAQEADATGAGASAFFVREAFEHDALIATLHELLLEKRRVATTGSLFLGDDSTGVKPLIRGYGLLRTIKSAAHASVYLARRESNGQDVVLKVLRQVPDLAESDLAFDRFLQEFEVIADIDHPNIVKIYDLGISDQHAHIVMEYLAGGDLKSRIGGGLDVGVAEQFLTQIASALAGIHESGILHRDLKPGNIMFRDDGSIALIDFGLARRFKRALAKDGSILGTPYYMSPEQGHGDAIDERSDIYSLGVIFFEMLTGEAPYQADSPMEVLYRHAKAPIPRLPDRLAGYQQLLDRLLAKNPADRLQSAAEMSEWL